MPTPESLSQELKSQQSAGNWDEVLRILGLLEAQGHVDRSLAEYLRQDAWVEKISHQGDLTSLSACINSVPTEIRRQRRVTAAMARSLISHDGGEFAHTLLAESLNAQWDGELVALYGECRAANVATQIEQAEKWLKLHRDEAGLLLALGRLCLHQGSLEKARDYLAASIRTQPSKEAYRSMAALLERSGELVEAQQYLQLASTLD